ncbi:MAG: histidinol-phosphatase [Gaiellaceae bacterium]
MIVDYHMHLRGLLAEGAEPLVHTLGAVERFVEQAAARGVDEIAFTEHVYYFTQTRELWSLPYQVERCLFDLDAYCDVILEAKRRGLPVKLGLEVDYVGERQERLSELIDGYPWDILIGSVHWLDELAVDSSVDAPAGVWAARPVEEVWRAYFDALIELARSRAVDVLAHPDLVKIFDRRPDRALVETLHSEAAVAIADSGVAIEVSTAGLRKPVRELYPDGHLLAECARRGVPITLASDAHQPALVGEDYALALELIRSVGIEEVAVFSERARSLERLPAPGCA